MESEIVDLSGHLSKNLIVRPHAFLVTMEIIAKVKLLFLIVALSEYSEGLPLKGRRKTQKKRAKKAKTIPDSATASPTLPPFYGPSKFVPVKWEPFLSSNDEPDSTVAPIPGSASGPSSIPTPTYTEPSVAPKLSPTPDSALFVRGSTNLTEALPVSTNRTQYMRAGRYNHTRYLSQSQIFIRLGEEAVDLKLNWTVSSHKMEKKNYDQFLINPSILFKDSGGGVVEIVRAARLHGFHNDFIRGEENEIREQIYNYHSSIVIRSEPFVGNLSASFDDAGIAKWGLNDLLPLEALDDTLLTDPDSDDRWDDLCEPIPHTEGHKLVRKKVWGPEDPKVMSLPLSKWGISFSSYPPVAHAGESCKWSEKAVFQMYLAPNGPSLADGMSGPGLHLSCSNPKSHEKNWIGFVYENQLYFIKSVEPLVVVLADENDGECETSYQSSNENLAALSKRFQVRGNAAALRYSGTEFLALLHTHDESPLGGGYTTRAFKFQAFPPFQVTSISKPLPLYEDRQAFASSLSIMNDKIIIGYGVRDEESRVLVMSKAYMEMLFRRAFLSDPYAVSLEERHLDRSFSHQKSFLESSTLIGDVFPRKMLFQAFTGNFGAIPLSENFAHLHVWKSGGTTIALQTGKMQTSLSDPEVHGLDLVVFVRDPIDHFLSGWAESGHRGYQSSRVAPDLKDMEYDKRISSYLEEVKAISYKTSKPRMTHLTHSFPQANFVLTKEGKVRESLKLVGDLSEMGGVLQLLGVDYNPDVHGRVAEENEIKNQYFPKRKDLISDKTMRMICEYVALDYFLFDFDPPQACAETGGPLDFSSTASD